MEATKGKGRSLDSEHGDRARGRNRGCLRCEAYAPVYQKPQIEPRRKRENPNNRNRRNGNRMRLYRVKTIRGSLAAATVRVRHSVAGAMSLHLAAAGTLLRRHACAGKRARHGWRNQRHDKDEDQREMARALHSFLEYQRHTGLVNAPSPATSQTASRAQVQWGAATSHPNVAWPNS
jgi:hypothetical protein